jgi:hypothetical protein
LTARDGTRVPADLSWWFLKLEFRRKLLPYGINDYKKGLDSLPTAPMMVQFLPAANWWEVQNGGNKERHACSKLSFSHTPSGWSVMLGGSLVTVNPTADSSLSNRFEVWALLTCSVMDAFGRPSQEAFIDLIPLSALSAFPGVPAPSFLRLVEVQTMGESSPQQSSWKGLADVLFANSQTDKIDPGMARARIVRVSPPIQVV